MLSGETQALLPKSYKPSCFPAPPPSPRDGTLYQCWKDTGCVCDDLPLWKQDSSRSISWAANTYDWCMTPAYLYDRFTYKVCCYGDSECFDCAATSYGCGVIACGLNILKIPCVSLGGTAALFSGIAGSVGDCISPTRELMDEPQPFFSVEIEEKNVANKTLLSQDGNINSKPDVHKTRAKKYILSLSDLTSQIDAWIKHNDLSAAINFFVSEDNKLDQGKFNILNHSELYPKRVFLICLAIRCPSEEITLETRKDFILALLNPEIIQGYNSTKGWITAPLLEATRSNYRYASDLLELLCEYGADVYKPCGVKDDLPYLLIWVYESLLENPNYELFYRATILVSYAKKVPENVHSFLKEGQNSEYKDIHTKVNTAAVPRAKRDKILKEVHTHTRIQNLSISRLICQYSGLFFSGTPDFCPIVGKSSSILITEQTSTISKTEDKEFQKQEIGLNRYNPLPDYRRLEALVIDLETDIRFNEGPALAP